MELFLLWALGRKVFKGFMEVGVVAIWNKIVRGMGGSGLCVCYFYLFLRLMVF